MASPTVDRRFGLVGNASIKAPVLVVATANLTLSGEQTIDGTAVHAVNASNAPDRVLCVGQNNSVENGIYNVSTAAWSRSADADGPYDLVKGSTVFVTNGTVGTGSYWQLTTTGPIVPGTTATAWASVLVGVNTAVATATAAAAATLADRILADADKAATATDRIATANYAAAAATGAKFYNTIALGIAGTANGNTFGVIAGGSDNLPRPTVYRNDAGSATLLYQTVTGVDLDDIYHERLFTAQARYFEERRTRSRDTVKPKAAVLVMLGQSNNTPGINTPAISGTPSPNAYMPIGGTALGYFQFYGTDASTACIWSDVASAVQYVESTSEGPGAGMIAALEGVFPRMYVCSAALGGVDILSLAGQGFRSNLYALVHKLCDHARAAGFEPVVGFTSVHGEANMSSFPLLTESQYYTYAFDYYRMAQRVAAQAMGMPDYIAPIVFFTPAQSQNADDSRGIINAVVRISRDIPNGILAGSINQWGMNADQIHNGPNTGERERGEYAGVLLRNYWMTGSRVAAPRAVDAVRAGVTVTVNFDQEVARRATILFGTNLNAANALDGVEYDDAGSNIKINSVVYSGRKAVFTLNSAPVGAAGSQYIRFGMQTTVNGAHPANTAGCLIAAANDNGEVSIYDGTVRSYRYVAPYKLAVR